MRNEIPLAWPDEHIEDVLHRMTENSLSTIPVMERDSEKFLGAINSHDIVNLMVNEASS